METLHAQGMFATGTVRTNRKDLPVLAGETQTMTKGEFKWRTKMNTAYIRWKDTKGVHILTTAFPCEETTVKRTQKDGSSATVKCPLAVFQYTNRMGGVDRFDDRRGRYHVSRCSRRWWLRIFYFFVDCSLVNAHILFNSVHDNTITMMTFRQQVIRGLVMGISLCSRKSNVEGCAWQQRKKRAATAKPAGVPDDVRLGSVGIHMPSSLPSFHRCRYCSTRTNNKRSKIMCCSCKVALCATPCFANFHK